MAEVKGHVQVEGLPEVKELVERLRRENEILRLSVTTQRVIDLPLPASGELRMCMICAEEKPWGVWSPMGAAVCIECRDKARAHSQAGAGGGGRVPVKPAPHQTPKEALQAAHDCLARIVCTTPPDDGVVLLSNDGPCHYDAERKCQVYDHEHFSPLGDALMELHGHLANVEAHLEQQIERTYQAKEHVMALLTVADWTQATLTALNVGPVASGSPLHLKLREVMVAYRDKREAAADKQSYDDLAASGGIVDAP